MRISQLAERSGVPATTLRFYEDTGLLPADRSPAGYLLYGEAAVERLAFIGAAKHLGLPLEEIGEQLGVWEAGACRDVKAGEPEQADQQRQTELRAAQADHPAQDADGGARAEHDGCRTRRSKGDEGLVGGHERHPRRRRGPTATAPPQLQVKAPPPRA
ncbi:MerR family transcriptional regulator [Streptomyces microflavus]|uniref:MerR family transcriptional regulator n=1 Tax=Streptomyces microflavus TaxID=1919 RepID=UPI0036467AB3